MTTEQATCDCKRLSCTIPCTKTHTCHAYSCEKCHPIMTHDPKNEACEKGRPDWDRWGPKPCTCGSDGSVSEPDHLTSLHISRAAMLECDEHYMELVRRAEKRAVEEYKGWLRKQLVWMEMEPQFDTTYSDTKYENPAVVYGYNEAISDILALLDNKSPE